MSQRERFVNSEGDAFFRRNDADDEGLTRRASRDLPLRAFEQLGLSSDRVLEIGASDGWRLTRMKERGQAARGVALDPSGLALREGARRFAFFSGVRATAERLPFRDAAFDHVILGFCLYLVDRRDLFRVAFEADRVLADGGLLSVFDFHSDKPYRNPYAHAEGCYSYKMDYAGMFSWHPAYQIIHRESEAADGALPGLDDRVAVTVMRREGESAFPNAPVPNVGVQEPVE